MRTFFFVLFPVVAFAQGSTVSVQEPISVLPPLVLNGAQVSCPGCGSGGGGGNPGGGGMPWNPPIVAPPTVASGVWTLLNGTGTGTYSDVTGGVQLFSNGPNGFTGNGMAGLYVPAPFGPFTVTAHLNAFCQLSPTVNGGPRYGLFFADAGNKIVDWQFGDIGAGPMGRFMMANWTSPTNPVSVAWAAPQQMTTLQDFWWRMQYDGSTFKYSISPTGADASSWTPLTSLASNGNLSTAPTKIGFEVYPQWAGASCNVTLGHWSVTQP